MNALYVYMCEEYQVCVYGKGVGIVSVVISLSYYLRFDHQFAENIVKDVRSPTSILNCVKNSSTNIPTHLRGTRFSTITDEIPVEANGVSKSGNTIHLKKLHTFEWNCAMEEPTQWTFLLVSSTLAVFSKIGHFSFLRARTLTFCEPKRLD